jgi:hypothetical protein
VVASDVLSPGSRIQEALSDVFCSDAVLHLVISFAICQAAGKISLLSVFEFRPNNVIGEVFLYCWNAMQTQYTDIYVMACPCSVRTGACSKKLWIVLVPISKVLFFSTLVS